MSSGELRGEEVGVGGATIVVDWPPRGSRGLFPEASCVWVARKAPNRVEFVPTGGTSRHQAFMFSCGDGDPEGFGRPSRRWIQI